jgi:hypothetical protein
MAANDDIKEDYKRLAIDCLYTSRGHFASAEYWGYVRLGLGLTTTFLAAISGITTIFTGGVVQIIGGLIALLSAMLAGLLTFLNPGDQFKNHQEAGVRYDELMLSIKYSCLNDFENADRKALIKKLEDYTERKIGYNLKYPDISDRSYRKVRRSIESSKNGIYTDSSYRNLGFGAPNESPECSAEIKPKS